VRCAMLVWILHCLLQAPSSAHSNYACSCVEESLLTCAYIGGCSHIVGIPDIQYQGYGCFTVFMWPQAHAHQVQLTKVFCSTQ
jgi:hypothetical protein